MDNLENEGRGVYACAEVQGLAKLLDAIEAHDDVQNVYANFDMDEALLAKLEQA